MSTTSSTLEIQIQAKDEASKKIENISAASNKMKGAFLALGGVMAGVFAADKIISFGKDAFKAFSDAEASSARVGATLATMGEKGLKARASIEAMSKAVTKLGFDDEDAAESITKLFQVTGDLTKAQKLNTTAMNLARAKNIDLATASNLVSQVLAGNGKVLKQYGIDIKDSATPLEALGILHEKVAGQAEAFAGTTQGSIEMLKVAYENFMEVVGEKLAKIITPLIQMASKSVEFLTNFEAVGDKLKGIFEFIDTKTGLITVLKDAWANISIVFQQQLLPALKELWKALEPLHPFFIALGQVLGVAFVAAIYLVIKAIEMLVIFVTTLLTWLAKLYTFIYGPMAQGFKKMVEVIEPVALMVERLVKALGNITTSGIEKIKNFFSGGDKKSSTKVNDAVISPSGRVITTNPNDFLIATQNPAGLAGAGGGGVTVNINGGTYLSEDVAKEIGDMIIQQFKRSVRI